VIDHAGRDWRAGQHIETNRPMLAPLGTPCLISMIGEKSTCSDDGKQERVHNEKPKRGRRVWIVYETRR